MNDINKQLIDFISASPSAYHTVENVRRELDAAGYTELFEGDDWSVTAPGKYYVRRNGSSIIALRLPKPDFRGFMVMAAHSDSPSFKIKWNSDVKAAGMYTMLNVEKYGGMLCSTWLDRPLSVAGRAIVAEGERMVSRLVNVDRDLAVIPNVAIHMDRSANDGKSYNANVDMLPLIGSAELKTGFKAIVAQSLGVAEDALLAGDLILYPRERGCVWGARTSSSPPHGLTTSSAFTAACAACSTPPTARALQCSACSTTKRSAAGRSRARIPASLRMCCAA